MDQNIFWMKSWIVFLTAAVVCAAQHDCLRGACYPPSGDLLLGREQNLKASSTCGLMGSEVICTPHGQWKMKCCPCDSRYPGAYNAHTIQNVLSSAGPNRWWQSKKDEKAVSLQFDLNGMFQLETLFLSFKGPRPDALIIERTRDFGRTWQPVLYMATDCPSAFPQVDTSLPRSLDDTYCYALPPAADDPYRDQKVHYYPVRQYENINLPNDYKIEVLSGLTGLRVNLTQLGAVPSMPGRSLSQFYALREMRVIGSCFCHGHASRCLPDNTDNYLFNTQVGGVCDCQHNTAGVNCERCDEFYNDLPWRPAENTDTHTCKRCECNNHAERCHFDPVRYEETGRRSGGVCDGCTHHTTGPNCERCATNYYPNPLSDMRSPDACLRCQCDSAGSLNSGQCDAVTGRCVCKPHVEGENCDRCKAGYYNLNANNPNGCSSCVCSFEGAVSSACDQLTGQCVCRPHAEGLMCDRCAAGYWKSPNGCQPCDCDPTNSRSSTCDQVTGQCQCRYGFAGRTCSGCPDNTFGDSRIGCRQCECDPSGTEPGGCDKRTGVCRCKPGVSGARCDACRRGHCAGFPQCPACPDCFFSLDSHLQNLTLHLERLSNYRIPDSGGSLSEEMNQRIRIIQNSLRQIQDSMTVPPASSDMLTETLQKLNTLKSEVKRLNEDMPPRPSDPDLKRRLDELQDLLSSIQLEYFTKRDAFINTAGTHNASTFNAIQKSYDTSTDAIKRAEATEKPLKNSSDVRENTLKDLNRLQPVNTRDLLNLKEDLATQPDLRPAAKKVCGSTRTEPCTPQKCEGDVCPPAGEPPCRAEEICVGALPNAHKALENTEEVKDKLQDLNNKITQALTQIQEAEDSANKARLSTDQLANQIKQVRSDVDGDLKDAKDFITTLRDFLSAPHSDPDEVQRVCEDVLEAKFPLSIENLKQKLKEMQDLASSLPDSSQILESTKPELDKARKLLEEAQNARDAALAIQEDTAGVLDSITENEDILKELENKIQQSLDIAKNVKQDVGKIEDALVPAEEGILGVTDLVNEMRPLLDVLKKDVQTGTGLANDARDKADVAQDEADQAAKDLEALKDEIEKLRQAAAENNEAGEVGDRVMNLVEEMSSLNAETANITTALRDKGAEIQERTAELEEKAQILTGLEDKLREIRDDIREKVRQLSMCQG